MSTTCCSLTHAGYHDLETSPIVLGRLSMDKGNLRQYGLRLIHHRHINRHHIY